MSIYMNMTTVEPPITDPPNNGPPWMYISTVDFCSRIADNFRIPNYGQALRTVLRLYFVGLNFRELLF